jgi:hypothetical protein
MKKEKKEASGEFTINDIARLYQTAATLADEYRVEAEKWKPKLIEFTKQAGGEVKFPCGVRVETRERKQVYFNPELATLEWLSSALDCGLENAISIKMDAKQMPEKLTAEQKAVLKEIAFKIQKNKVFAVCIK